MTLVLASTSPYRRELLGRLRIPFSVEAPLVDEARLPGEEPLAMAQRLARQKAHAVAQNHPDALVLGADQTLALGTEVLGKPGDFERAFAQLQRLNGREAVFHSAWALVRGGGVLAQGDCPTEVRFAALSPLELERYLRLEQPFDCAGSAKAEGLGISLMERLRSDDPTAIIGLPLIGVAQALRKAGLSALSQV